MKPKLSIIIACYNDPSVGTAVSSAYEQTYSNKEIILVDDGSDKVTKQAIEVVKDLLTQLIVQDNKGQSNARNQAISVAKGEYVLNLDSDDYFENSFCEKAIEYFENDNEIKIVTCKARRFSTKGTIDVFTPKGGKLIDFLFSNSALGSAMFRKDDWRKTGGYEEKLPILGFEDWEFYIQLLKNGGRAHVIPEVLFNYQIRKGSTTNRIQHLKLEKFKEIILKHSDLYKEEFPALINFFVSKIHKEEKEKKLKFNSLEYKIGQYLLLPLRYLKSKFFVNN